MKSAPSAFAYVALASLAFTACAEEFDTDTASASASEKPTTSAPNPETATLAQHLTLATVDVSYGNLEFYKSVTPDGKSNLGLIETSSAYASRTPLNSLLEQKEFTLLELFKATAPNREPPADLVASHPSEAAALGRADPSVQIGRFNPEEPIQKSLEACRQAAFPNSNVWATANHREATSHDPGFWLPVNDYYWGASPVNLAACNESYLPTNVQMAYIVDGITNGWVFETPVFLYAYQKRVWLRIARHQVGPELTGQYAGNIALPVIHGAAYAVRTLADSGRDALLMTATNVAIIR